MEAAADLAALLSLKRELDVIRAELKFRRVYAEIMGRLRALRDGEAGKAFNPNQPRVPAGSREGGQWASGGSGGNPSGGRIRFADRSAGPNITANDSTPEPMRVWAQYAQISNTQDPRIDKTAEVLQNILVKVNAAVSSRQDALSGALYGIRVHTEFAAAVRSQNLPGIGTDGVEQSFDANGLSRYGMDGSIRTDVVLRDDSGNIIAIYDVKTGKATMGPIRAEEIRAYTRVGTEVPIIILHALRGTSLR